MSAVRPAGVAPAAGGGLLTELRRVVRAADPVPAGLLRAIAGSGPAPATRSPGPDNPDFPP